MHYNDINLFDSRLGMAFGFVGFIWKIYNFIVLQAQTSESTQSLLTIPNFLDSAIMAAWCTLIGLGITWFVNRLQKVWLGIQDKKKIFNVIKEKIKNLFKKK